MIRDLKNVLLNENVWLRETEKKEKILEFMDLVKPVATNLNLMRIGGNGDGGYLVPDDLDGIDVCFSPGVSAISDFENDLTKRGIRCFLADASVAAPSIKNDLFDFEQKHLGSKNDGMFMTLESWINQKAQNESEFILQMDIEGGEYPVIFSTSGEVLKKFRILVIEFHYLDSLFDVMGGSLIRLTFEKLLEYFDIVHVHPNNCGGKYEQGDIVIPAVMEFTFLRKDRIAQRGGSLSFPHELDRPNVSGIDDIILPQCWRPG